MLAAKSYSSQQHGNKTANLGKINELLKDEPGVSVPEFLGLSHDDVCSHLKGFGVDIDARWQVISTAMGIPPELNDQVKLLLKQLQDAVKECLVQHPFPQEKIASLLGEDFRLMVRSTGKEDTEELANAGGNESIANVVPDSVSISNAMAAVISSYISDKSLLQRQLAEDDISTPPFFPVLLQKMISSNPDAKERQVVKSGVIYINQSGSYIQAAPGHGELVVNSKGPVDSYWFTKNNVMVPNIVEKTIRIIPQESREEPLIITKNSPFLANTPSLAPAVVERLARIAKKIYEGYGKPMDIEYVYDPATDIISVVQARPIVTTKLSLEPSALHPDLVDLGMKNHAWLEGQSIVPPGNALPLAHVREITSTNQIVIIKKMSDDELKKCIKLAKEGILKAVVIEKPLPATSHEAATLSGAGIPIIYMENTTELKKVMQKANEGKPVYFDRQRGAFLATATLGDISLDKSEWIQKGIFASSLSPGSTPLPIGLNTDDMSIHRQSQPKERSLAELIEKARKPQKEIAEPAINELIAHLHSLSSVTGAELKTHDARVACRTLLTNLSEASNANVNVAIAQLIRYAFKMNKSINSRESNLVFQNIVLLIAEYAELRQNQPGMSNAEHLLDLAKKVEGLFFEKSSPREFNYSLNALLEEKLVLKRIDVQCKVRFGHEYARLPQEKKSILIQLIYFNSYLLTKEGKDQWDNFCFQMVHMEPSPGPDFLNTLESLNKEGLLETALHLILLPAVFNPDVNPTELTQKLGELLEYKNTVLARHYASLTKLESTLEQWGNPAVSRDAFMKLCAELKQTGTSIIQLSSDSDERKHVISQLKFKYIEILDNSVKALKASDQLSLEEKLFRFKEMLFIYKECMEQLLILDVSIDEYTALRHFDLVAERRELEPLTPKAMLAAINTKFNALLENNLGEEQFLSSGQFAVCAAMFNTGGSFARAFIDPALTLEDFFTLFHQNSLASIQRETAPDLIKMEHLPEKIQLLISSIERIKLESKSEITLLQSSYTFPDLSYSYNLPLRNHALTLDVKVNVITGKVDIRFVEIGIESVSRMTQTADLIRLDCMASGDTLSDLTVTTGRVNTIIDATISTSIDSLSARMQNNPDYLVEYFVKYIDISNMRGDASGCATTFPSIIWTIENNPHNFDNLVEGILSGLERNEWGDKVERSFENQWRGPRMRSLPEYTHSPEFFKILINKIKSKIEADPHNVTFYDSILRSFDPSHKIDNFTHFKNDSNFIDNYFQCLPLKEVGELEVVIATALETNLAATRDLVIASNLIPVLSVIISEGVNGLDPSGSANKIIAKLNVSEPAIKDVLKTLIESVGPELPYFFREVLQKMDNQLVTKKELTIESVQALAKASQTYMALQINQNHVQEIKKFLTQPRVEKRAEPKSTPKLGQMKRTIADVRARGRVRATEASSAAVVPESNPTAVTASAVLVNSTPIPVSPMAKSIEMPAVNSPSAGGADVVDATQISAPTEPLPVESTISDNTVAAVSMDVPVVSSALVEQTAEPISSERDVVTEDAPLLGNADLASVPLSAPLSTTTSSKDAMIQLLDKYLQKRAEVVDSKQKVKEYFHGSFFSFLQKSYTEKCEAVDALKSALDGDKIALSEHLSTLRNGHLGKELRKFIKTGQADELVHKKVRTVSDFISELEAINKKDMGMR